MRTDHDPTPERPLGTVGQAMTTAPVLVLDADTPADVAARQLTGGVAGAVVLHRGRVVGVVTLADMLARPSPACQCPGSVGRSRAISGCWPACGYGSSCVPDRWWWQPISR